MTRAEQISERAAHWILQQEDAAWSANDQAELDAWLRESDGHRTAYLRLRHSWRAADRITALGGTRDQVPVEELPPSRARSYWIVPTAIAASLALALGLAQFVPPWPGGTGEPTATARYETAVGGRRIVGFADGSRVQLNTQSVLRATIRQHGREVWLDQGEAFFDVAHRDGVPFIVHAGNRQVTVLGTKFSVRRKSDQVTVTVLEGRVRVDDVRSGRAVRSSIIVGGDIAIAQGAATLVTSRSVEKVEDALAWRNGMLSFDNTSLQEIATEFNRYNARKLTIVGPQAAAIKVGGMFEAIDPMAFARLMRDAYGLSIEETPGEVKISS